MAVSITDQQKGITLARILYQRGVVTLAEASRLASLSEDDFLGSLKSEEVDSFDTIAIAHEESFLTLPAGFKLSVLMAVYNESRTLLEVLDKVRAVDLPKEIIVVDDGSTDGTRELLREKVEGQFPDVTVIYHSRNSGKGAAIRTAITHATGNICIIQDADLELDPFEYPQLLQPILKGQADAVYGSRFLHGGAHRVKSYRHYWGNKLLTTFSNLVTNLYLTDMETCYKVCRTEILKSLRLRANRFDIEPEITVKLARAGVRIYEVPISYNPRNYDEGKKIGIKDGFQAIWAILRHRFSD